MSKALKGALLSGLVFPGLGQLVLRHYARAGFFILTVIAAVTGIVVRVSRKALVIVGEMESEGGTIDLDRMSEAVNGVSAAADSRFVNLLFWGIVVCWVISIIDAYRIGSKLDRTFDPEDSASTEIF